MKRYKQIGNIGIAAILLLGSVSPLITTVGRVSALTGGGTSSDPYVVTTCDDLQNINNDLTAYYVLGQNIDCSADTGFTPIGAGSEFTGTLDGGGFSISNLTVDAGSNDTGLFYALNGATVKNVRLEGGDVFSGTAGGSLAFQADSSTISDVYSRAEVDTGGDVGGLLASATDTDIQASYFSGTVSLSGTGAVLGGLVARQTRGTISDSYTAATPIMWGNNTDGGLVGLLSDGTIERSYSSAAFGGVPSSTVGGLVGEIQSSSGSSITDSFAAGHITTDATSADGAVFGTVTGPVTFTNTYFDQTATGQTQCGGSVVSGCAAVNTDGSESSYFYLNTNAPLNNWDFSGVWETYGTWYPTLIDPYAVVPPTPIDVRIARTTAATVSLAWDAAPPSPHPVTGYDIRYKESSQDASSWQDMWVGVTAAASVNSLLAHTSYDFEVAAENDVGPSAYSATVTAVTSELTTYYVTTCQQLQNMSNDLGGRYILSGNIDCSGTVHWNGGAGFVPVGSTSAPFGGTLDGQGHTISGLHIDTTDDYVGLFSALAGAKVSNVRLTGVDITGGSDVGAIAAVASQDVTIDYVAVDGQVVSDAQDAVGDAPLLGVGGLVGVSSTTTVSHSSMSGVVSGAAGSVLSMGVGIGGLIGEMMDTSTVSNSYSTARVVTSDTGSFAAGGLAGVAVPYLGTGTDPVIADSYAAGQVGANSNSYAGGLAGMVQQSEIDNSFTAVSVVGVDGSTPSIGAVAAVITDATLSGVYVDGSAIGVVTCDASGGVTDCAVVNADGSQPNYFFGNGANPPLDAWDFDTVWQTRAADYPVLRISWRSDSPAGGSTGGVAGTDSTVAASSHYGASVVAPDAVAAATAEPDSTDSILLQAGKEPGLASDAQPQPADSLWDEMTQHKAAAGVIGLLVLLIILLFFFRRRRKEEDQKGA